MNKRLVLLLPLLLLAACAGSREVRLTSEPSIERAMDAISLTPEGKALLKFLRKNPVSFEYSNTAGLCHKFSLRAGKIFLPQAYKGSDLILALAIARAGHIYRLYTLSGLDEIISEEEELGALFQARLAVQSNLATYDFDSAGGAPEIKNDFCTYVLQNSDYAREKARIKALTPDPNCLRPLDTLQNQRVWLEKTRQAINDESFYQLLYERDWARVKKGALTAAEAMKNDSVVRAMPIYEVYRYQRTFYDKQSDIFTRFGKLYSEGISEDAAWRSAHQPEIDRMRHEFSDCNMP
ncbi:MAG: hypothetical protein COX65_03390 [Elusimicrobia bacterium CG_4_10_14_0_2_um_filter_56_8]|nr:MAG: hypothetical protein AUJ51_05160 [Elusimicrobia bacterium CG1_02_56_21]PJA16020.1 MAG: hypothetical protein COX65_03390 [Elusimicrobia bacterium CG_4_10_14_0_2_um_filter_56_8]